MVRPGLDARTPLAWMACALLVAVAPAGCDGQPGDPEPAPATPSSTTPSPAPSASTAPHRGPVTLGFVGDLHFEDDLAALLRRRGPVLDRSTTAALRAPDLMIANLETTLTRRGRPETKEYNFRASARALDVLDDLGVDLVTLGNNHAIDYGRTGLRDTLAAVRHSPVPVVGIGKDEDAAFRARTFTIRGTTIAVLGASTKTDHTARFWAAGPGRPGIAVAARPEGRLLTEVRRAAARADVVVAYLHWGLEYRSCPNHKQPDFVRALAAAGADVVVGSHAHVLQGQGWRGDTYVGYGLGNFLWYNQNAVDTGILELTVRHGEVVADSFRPARIQADGRPRLLRGPPRAAALTRWERLRGCAGLAARPPSP